MTATEPPAAVPVIQADDWRDIADAPHETPIIAQYHEWNDPNGATAEHVVWFYAGGWRPYPMTIGDSYAERWRPLTTPTPPSTEAQGEGEGRNRIVCLLQCDNAAMAEALRQCRDQFAFYAREHYATGKSEKGDTNTRFADIANKPLKAVQPNDAARHRQQSSASIEAHEDFAPLPEMAAFQPDVHHAGEPVVDRQQSSALGVGERPEDAGEAVREALPKPLQRKEQLRELDLLYHHDHNDSRQFTREQMLVAIYHGHRLAVRSMSTPIFTPPLVSEGEAMREAAAKVAEADNTPGYGPHRADMEALAQIQRQNIAFAIRALSTPPQAAPVSEAATRSTAGKPDEELEKLRKLSMYASDGPWEIDSEWNADGAYGGGPDHGTGYDDYLILDHQGRTLFSSENSTAKMIEEEHDEDGGTAWDQVAKRNAAFIVACVAYVRAALAANVQPEVG